LPSSVILVLQALMGLLLGLSLAELVRRRRRGNSVALPGTLALLLLLLIFIPVLGWKPSPGPPSRRLRVLSVLDLETTEALVRAFHDRSDIECEVDPFAGGAQTSAQLILGDRVQPDVLLGGTVEVHDRLAQAGKLRPVAGPLDAGRVDRYDEDEHRWTPLYLGYLALLYRPLPTFLTHPPDWNTLLDQRWRGRVTVPSPLESGGGLVFVATQIQRQPDPERGWEYLRLLLESGARFEPRSEVPIERIASGTMDLGVSWAHDIQRGRIRDRLPVELVIPEETGYEVGAVSVLEWARDPDAAEEFVRFLTGPEAGRIQATIGFRVPLRIDVDLPDYAEAADLLQGARTAFYDRQRVIQERSQWQERWTELRGSRR
jgi:iron(III) transport system substrate-binding protein